MAPRMEYVHEYIKLAELTTKLNIRSEEGWEVVSVMSAHANTFEFGDDAQVLVVLKRPVRNNS